MAAGDSQFPSDAAMRRQFFGNKNTYSTLATMLAEDSNVSGIQGDKLSLDNLQSYHSAAELNFPLERFKEYQSLLKTISARFVRDYQDNLRFMRFAKDSTGTIRGSGVVWRKKPISSLTFDSVDKFNPNKDDSTSSCYSPIEGNWYLSLSQTNP